MVVNRSSKIINIFSVINRFHFLVINRIYFGSSIHGHQPLSNLYLFSLLHIIADACFAFPSFYTCFLFDLTKEKVSVYPYLTLVKMCILISSFSPIFTINHASNHLVNCNYVCFLYFKARLESCIIEMTSISIVIRNFFSSASFFFL